MILINKVTPFANETFQKDLIECVLHNVGISFISSIIVFHNNTNIIIPKHNKIKLVVKQNYSDREIIEYCKLISNDEIFIFSNPFVKFNNTLINLETPVKKPIKIGEDCFIFSRNEKLENESIESAFPLLVSNNKILIERKNIWTKEFTNIRKEQKFIVKENFKNSKVPKIDIVIVSVDYNDTLPITLGSIPSDFSVTVVTTYDDLECQKICSRLNAKCVISERLYEEDASFNKGKAINDGINSLENPEWILLLDADIYLKEDFINIIKSTNLSHQDLFICKRLIIENNEDFEKWKKGENVGKMERAKGYGFFHLFNAKYRKRKKFPENYSDASFSDLEFRDSFNSKKELDTYVIHLGSTSQNWKGRKTESFVNKIELPHTLSNQISSFENLVKKNIRIVSNSKFNLNNGGIYNPGLFYLENKKYIVARCEKNFESYLGNYDKYWNNLTSPMYFEIDDEFKIVDFGVFKMENYPIMIRYEDFRVFEHNGKIISNHTVITPNYNYKNEDTWPNMNVCSKPGIFISVSLSEINIEDKSMINKKTIKLEDSSNMEKNWSFFSENGELYFIYSLDPFVVYKKENEGFIKIIDKKYKYEWNVNTDGMKYCISTNLKRLNDEYYILLFHTKIKGYKYVQGCMLLNNNLEPVYMTKNPILESEKMKGKYPNVLYAFSVDIKDDEIHVYYGEADTNCCVAIIDKEVLLDNILKSNNSHKIKEVTI